MNYNPHNKWIEACGGKDNQYVFIGNLTKITLGDREMDKYEEDQKARMEHLIRKDCQKGHLSKLLSIINFGEKTDIEFTIEDQLPIVSEYIPEEEAYRYFTIPLTVNASYTVIPTPSRVCLLEDEKMYDCYSYKTNVCYTVDFEKVYKKVNLSGRFAELFQEAVPRKYYFYRMPCFTTARTHHGEMAITFAKYLSKFYYKNQFEFFRCFKQDNNLQEVSKWLQEKYH